MTTQGWWVLLEIAEELCCELGLTHAQELLSAKVEAATNKESSYVEFLISLLSTEAQWRRQRSYETRLKLSALPHKKGLSEFDFDFAKGVDRTLINELASLAFVARCSNVVLLGPPGVGKTHLSVGLALLALEGGNSVYFTTMTRLANDLSGTTTTRRARKYLAPRVLIVDEIGYRNLSPQAASVFFDVISARYETGSIICSSNKGFSEWGNLIGDPVLATAILDRLLHHSTVINIRGESYRLKDRKKQGIGANPEVKEALARGGDTEKHELDNHPL
jgi:DNA replication protein DnaC